MQVVLVMFKADGAKRTFPLNRDTTIIGRREDCDLRIPLTEISRKHCRIIKSASGVRVEDLGSSNGTYHNNTRVSEAEISPGDLIQIGPVIFTVQIDGVPATDEIVPPIAAASDQGDSLAASFDLSADAPEATEMGSSPAAPIAMSNRPLSPVGDDFPLPSDDDDDDDDIVDLHPISPQDDEEEDRR